MDIYQEPLSLSKSLKYDSLRFNFKYEFKKVGEDKQKAGLYIYNRTSEVIEPLVDSVFITVDRVYVNGVKAHDNHSAFFNDFTDILGYPHFEDLWEFNSSYIESTRLSNKFLIDDLFAKHHFVINTPPTKIDTFQFTFQFYDTEGNIFETTTDPIIITP